MFAGKTFNEVNIKFRIGNLLCIVDSLSCIPFPPGNVTRWHYHKYYEFHFIRYGKGTVSFDSGSYQIKTGDFFLTGPGIYHIQTADASDPFVEYCIALKIRKGIKNKANCYTPQDESEMLDNIILNNRFWFESNLQDSFEIFEELFYELENREIGTYTSAVCLVTRIIIHCIRCFKKTEDSKLKFPEKTLNERREWIIRRLLEEKRLKDLSINDIAEKLHVSRRHAERIIKEIFGCKFSDLINFRRLEYVKKALANTSSNITDLAFEAGFNSLCTFNKAFKAYTKLTPREFRKINHKNILQQDKSVK